jgi:hypothetical protein
MDKPGVALMKHGVYGPSFEAIHIASPAGSVLSNATW